MMTALPRIQLHWPLMMQLYYGITQDFCFDLLIAWLVLRQALRSHRLLSIRCVTDEQRFLTLGSLEFLLCNQLACRRVSTF